MNYPDFPLSSLSSRKQYFLVVAGLLCWGLTMIAGMMFLADYSSSPNFRIRTIIPEVAVSSDSSSTRASRIGFSSDTVVGTDSSDGAFSMNLLAKEWPATVGFTPVRGRPTLVICLHPRCPCSLASLRQLERVLAKGLNLTKPETQCSVVALFYCPEKESSSWSHTQLWSMAAKIPNSTLLVDRDAQAATKFGASTSGQVLFYADGGQLLFSGGITSGRGHEGDNPASQTLTRILSGQQVEQHEFAVFGCAIIATVPSLALANP